MSFNPFFYNDSPLPLDKLQALIVMTTALDERVSSLEELGKRIELIIDDLEQTVKDEIIAIMTEWKEDGTFLSILAQLGFSGIFPDYLDSRILIRDSNIISYKYNEAPLGVNYSTIQGLTYTKNNNFMGSFASGLNVATGYGSTYDNTVVLKEFSSSGALIRQSQPLPIDHSNTLSFDIKRNVIYSCNHEHYNYGGSREYNKLISVIDYDTLTVIKQVNLTRFNGSYLDSVSYDSEKDKIVIAQYTAPTQAQQLAFIDPDNLETGEIEYLTLDLPLKTSQLGMNSYHAGCKLKNDFIFVMSAYPSTLYCLNKNGKLLKCIALDDEIGDLHETEDFDIDDDFNFIYGTHRRFFNRDDISTSYSTGSEIVETITTIRKSNLITSAPKEDIRLSTSGYRNIYVDPNTSNTIQNGEIETPCKSIMEAYYISLSYETIPCRFIIPETASGYIDYIEIIQSAKPISIFNRSIAVYFSDNIHIVQSDIRFFNCRFIRRATTLIKEHNFVSLADSQNENGYGSQVGLCVQYNSTIFFDDNCSMASATRPFGVYNSTLISQKTFSGDIGLADKQVLFLGGRCDYRGMADDLTNNNTIGNRYNTYYINNTTTECKNLSNSAGVKYEIMYKYGGLWHNIAFRGNVLTDSLIVAFEDDTTIDLTNNTFNIKINNASISPASLLVKISYNK